MVLDRAPSEIEAVRNEFCVRSPWGEMLPLIDQVTLDAAAPVPGVDNLRIATGLQP